MIRFMLLPLLLSGCALNVMEPPTGDLSQMPLRDLCASYAPGRDPAIKAELVARNEFTEAEWKRIERGQRKPDGMREAVLWCAWGLPGDFGDVSQTTTGATRYRYKIQYNGGFDIVVANGVVTDWTAF